MPALWYRELRTATRISHICLSSSSSVFAGLALTRGHGGSLRRRSQDSLKVGRLGGSLRPRCCWWILFTRVVVSCIENDNTYLPHLSLLVLIGLCRVGFDTRFLGLGLLFSSVLSGCTQSHTVCDNTYLPHLPLFVLICLCRIDFDTRFLGLGLLFPWVVCYEIDRR